MPILRKERRSSFTLGVEDSLFRFWDPEDPLVDGELSDGWTVLAGLEYWEVNLFLGMENERFGCVLISKEEEGRGREDK